MMPLWMQRWAASRGPKDGYSRLMLRASLMGIITVRNRYDQEYCVRAGRIWQRAHLLATARGVAGRPCNEAVEMIDHVNTLGKPARRPGLLAEILGDAAWQPADPRQRQVSTALRAYAAMATSAARGAVRDVQSLRRR